MSSIQSSASLFRSACEDQDLSIPCPIHAKSVVFSICSLPKCEYGQFICPKCAIEKPEHLVTHKHYIELFKEFGSRYFNSEASKEADFKKWEQEVQQKINEISAASETFEKSYEELVSRKLSSLNEKLSKNLQSLQESLKGFISHSETAALQDLKKKMTGVVAKVNIEKAFHVIDKTRVYEATRNRKEIQDSLEVLSQDTEMLTNSNAKISQIENLLSAVANQFQNICSKLGFLLRPQGNSLAEAFLEITRQNAIFEAEIQKLYLKKSYGSATLSNYSSNSTQQKSQENLKESGEKMNNYTLDKSPPMTKAREETKFSNPDLQSKMSQPGYSIAIQEEPKSSGLRGSQKEGGNLLLFKACEEKVKAASPLQFKSTISYEEVKSFIESYIKTNYTRESIIGTSYYGEIKNGRRFGYGVDIQGDEIYIGEYRDDLPNGKGQAIYKNADFYEGEWVNGKFEGIGKYVIRGSAIMYSGQFVRGLKEGYGVEERGDGSRFEGNFKEGQKQGKGLYRWAIGEKYEGEFFENKMHGNGTYNWNDGTVYVGEWRENKLSGNGLLIEGNGGRYLGSFKNDKKEGYGVYTWSDGWIYRGNWKNGVQDGIGTEVDPKGSSRVCLWNSGTMVKSLAQ